MNVTASRANGRVDGRPSALVSARRALLMLKSVSKNNQLSIKTVKRRPPDFFHNFHLKRRRHVRCGLEVRFLSDEDELDISIKSLDIWKYRKRSECAEKDFPPTDCSAYEAARSTL